MRRTTVVVAVLLGLVSWLHANPRNAPAPPKDAQYTIFCARIEGDAHVERATRLKNDLARRSGMNQWHLVHEEGQSLLYYGFYRTFSDPTDRRETDRAQGDLRRIKSLNIDGHRMFAAALFVDLESPDPVAPPEWNLINASGAWTIQIAAYKDSPLHKQAAVDAVRDARKMGVEAYYYHGDTVSSVCIGAWPEEAVLIRQAGRENVGTTDPVLVAPAGVPEDIVRGVRDVKVVREQIQVLDPTMLATMREYPHHALNGEHIARTINGVEVIEPSLLVRIPQDRQQSTGLAGADDPRGHEGAAPPGQPALTPRPAPAPPGLGRLKSVDE